MAVKSVGEFLEDFFLKADRRSEEKFMCNGESMTQQQWKDIVDVNNIVKSVTQNAFNERWFRDLGEQVLQDARRFTDVSNVPDLQTAYGMLEEAKQSFVQNIPFKIREKFSHDPVAFYKFAADVNNVGQLSTMLKDVSNYNAPSLDRVVEGNNQAVVDAVDSNAVKQNKA